MSDQNKRALGTYPESATIYHYGTPGGELNAIFTLFKTDTEPYAFTCQVQIQNPSIRVGNYEGSLRGHVYSIEDGSITQIVLFQGSIIQQGVTNPMEYPFNAFMLVDNSWNGKGGFTYANVHVENAPVKAT